MYPIAPIPAIANIIQFHCAGELVVFDCAVDSVVYNSAGVA